MTTVNQDHLKANNAVINRVRYKSLAICTSRTETIA